MGWWLLRYVQARVRSARVKVRIEAYPPGGVEYAAESVYSTLAICLDDFTTGEEVAELGCRHLFHPGCVKDQIKYLNTRCTICNIEFGGV